MKRRTSVIISHNNEYWHWYCTDPNSCSRESVSWKRTDLKLTVIRKHSEEDTDLPINAAQIGTQYADKGRGGMGGRGRCAARLPEAVDFLAFQVARLMDHRLWLRFFFLLDSNMNYNDRSDLTGQIWLALPLSLDRMGLYDFTFTCILHVYLSSSHPSVSYTLECLVKLG